MAGGDGIASLSDRIRAWCPYVKRRLVGLGSREGTESGADAFSQVHEIIRGTKASDVPIHSYKALSALRGGFLLLFNNPKILVLFLITSGILGANTWWAKWQILCGYPLSPWTRFAVTLLVYSFVYVVEVLAVYHMFVVAMRSGENHSTTFAGMGIRRWGWLCVNAAIIGLLYGVIATPANFPRVFDHLEESANVLGGTTTQFLFWLRTLPTSTQALFGPWIIMVLYHVIFFYSVVTVAWYNTDAASALRLSIRMFRRNMVPTILVFLGCYSLAALIFAGFGFYQGLIQGLMDTYIESYSDAYFFDEALSIFRSFATGGFLRGLTRASLAVAFMVSIGAVALDIRNRGSSPLQRGGRTSI